MKKNKRNTKKKFVQLPSRGTPLNMFAQRAHEIAREKGFWRGEAGDVGKKLLLIHSEVSEAAEEYRTNGTDKLEYLIPVVPTSDPFLPIVFASTVYQQKPEGFGPELADVLIRTMDLMYALGLNVEDVVKRKMEFNATRGKLHGKRW